MKAHTWRVEKNEGEGWVRSAWARRRYPTRVLAQAAVDQYLRMNRRARYRVRCIRWRYS